MSQQPVTRGTLTPRTHFSFSWKVSTEDTAAENRCGSPGQGGDAQERPLSWAGPLGGDAGCRREPLPGPATREPALCPVHRPPLPPQASLLLHSSFLPGPHHDVLSRIHHFVTVKDGPKALLEARRRTP